MAALSIPRPVAEVAATTVDHLYFSWFAALSALILIFHSRLPGWPDYLALHAIVVIAILTLISLAPTHRWDSFLHDWYPFAVFILCFEEVARLSLLLAASWQDQYILGFEARLFPTPPTVWLAAHGNWLITEFMELGYFSYFVLLMIVGGALYSRPGRREFRQVMTASVVSYLICLEVRAASRRRPHPSRRPALPRRRSRPIPLRFRHPRRRLCIFSCPLPPAYPSPESNPTRDAILHATVILRRTSVRRRTYVSGFCAPCTSRRHVARDAGTVMWRRRIAGAPHLPAAKTLASPQFSGGQMWERSEDRVEQAFKPAQVRAGSAAASAAEVPSS